MGGLTRTSRSSSALQGSASAELPKYAGTAQRGVETRANCMVSDSGSHWAITSGYGERHHANCGYHAPRLPCRCCGNRINQGTTTAVCSVVDHITMNIATQDSGTFVGATLTSGPLKHRSAGCYRAPKCWHGNRPVPPALSIIYRATLPFYIRRRRPATRESSWGPRRAAAQRPRLQIQTRCQFHARGHAPAVSLCNGKFVVRVHLALCRFFRWRGGCCAYADDWRRMGSGQECWNRPARIVAQAWLAGSPEQVQRENAFRRACPCQGVTSVES